LLVKNTRYPTKVSPDPDDRNGLLEVIQIIGFIFLQERDIQSLTSTLKHELLHALGFSSSLYAYFR